MRAGGAPPDSIHRQIACNIFRLVADKVCSMAFVYVSYLSIRPDTHARSSITQTTTMCAARHINMLRILLDFFMDGHHVGNDYT